MTLMRIREITSCAQHKRTIIMLEDVHRCLRLTFYADPDEACRLTQELERGPYACHPVYDFMRRLLLLRSRSLFPLRQHESQPGTG